jgi:hypothetical protein
LDTHDTTPTGLRGPVVLAVLLIAAGLAVNHWSIGWTFSAEGFLDNEWLERGIVAGQVLLCLLGLLVLWRRPRVPLAAGVSLVLLLVSAAGLYQTVAARRVWAVVADQRAILTSINHSEDLLQWINPDLRHFGSDAMNLSLPGARGRPFFADEVTFVDVLGPDEGHGPDVLGGGLAEVHHWRLAAEETTRPLDELELWKPFFERVEYFEHAKFYFVKGLFLDEEESQFETEMGFAALARLDDGRLAHATAKLKVLWKDHTRLFGDKDWCPTTKCARARGTTGTRTRSSPSSATGSRSTIGSTYSPPIGIRASRSSTSTAMASTTST